MTLQDTMEPGTTDGDSAHQELTEWDPTQQECQYGRGCTLRVGSKEWHKHRLPHFHRTELCENSEGRPRQPRTV